MRQKQKQKQKPTKISQTKRRAQWLQPFLLSQSSALRSLRGARFWQITLKLFKNREQKNLSLMGNGRVSGHLTMDYLTCPLLQRSFEQRGI